MKKILLFYVGSVLFSRENFRNYELFAPLFRVIGHDSDDQLVCLQSNSINFIVSESDKHFQDRITKEGLMNENFFENLYDLTLNSPIFSR